jgi:septin family protein
VQFIINRRHTSANWSSILVIGEQNSGKTSFIEFLRNALSDKRQKREKMPSPPQTGLPVDSAFTPYYLETDIDHERIGVTLWDSQGLEKKFVDLQLREMSSFLESKFEETFTEEQKVVRAPGVRDTHIHCVFLILDPTRLNANLVSTRKAKQTSALDEPARLIGALDEDLDIQVLKTLQGKTTVIPVISKADTITTPHMALLKKSVWNSLKQAKLDPLEVLNVVDESEDDEGSFDEREEDAYLGSKGNTSDVIDKLLDRSSDEDEEEEEEAEEEGGQNGNPNSTPQTSPSRSRGANKDAVKAHRRSMSDALSSTGSEEIPFLPMSIISPDSYEPGIVGRRFPWGFADPYNQEHCDFLRLKDAVFSEWRAELREASREVWYEGWRTSRLRKRDRTPPTAAGGAAGQYRKTAASAGLSTRPEMARGAYRQGIAF